jgi:hypothetical protein
MGKIRRSVNPNRATICEMGSCHSCWKLIEVGREECRSPPWLPRPEDVERLYAIFRPARSIVCTTIA